MKKFVAVAVLCIGSVGALMFYQTKYVDARINKKIAEVTISLNKQTTDLWNSLKKLERDQQKIINQKSPEKELVDIKVDFDKWDCWCALRNKLKQGKDFSVELKKFQEVFADNPDLLNLVESEIKETEEGGRLNKLTNNLLKFAKIRSISEGGLERISGYILLLSVKGMRVNE